MNEPDGKGEPLIHLYQYDQQDHALFHQLSNHICISSAIKYDLWPLGGSTFFRELESIAKTVLSFKSHLIELISNYVPRNIMFVISLRSQYKQRSRKANILSIKVWIFSFISVKICVVGTKK